MEYAGQDLAKSIKRLDFNIAYACNLSCKGCISLSDMDRRGIESFESIEQQCAYWSKLIDPQVITLFGGEPLLHPRIHDIIICIKSYWSKCTIRLITNGYLLAKHDPCKWLEYSPFEMQISVHRKDHEHLITREIRRILECKSGWQVNRKKQNGHKDIEFTLHDFKIYKSFFEEFVKPYRDDLTPFNSDPVLAHASCGSPNTPVLYKNKLYKCPPVANILDIIPKYTDYEGISHNEDISQFIENIGKPESVCAMCPDTRTHSIDHYSPGAVHVKNLD
tara:strand:- start:866 stop:1696 length:831 start_codon:yes stop_codon:yes gene_type:complete